MYEYWLFFHNGQVSKQIHGIEWKRSKVLKDKDKEKAIQLCLRESNKASWSN
jgi:predicted glutamine amidotransferase